MSAHRLLFLQLYVLIAVALLHLIGTALFLYWTFWWYDILVHFLASVWVAMIASWTSLAWGVAPRLWFLLLCVLTVSLGWELFEYVIGATEWGELLSETILDTILDVTVNTIGACTGFLLTRGAQSTGGV